MIAFIISMILRDVEASSQLSISNNVIDNDRRLPQAMIHRLVAQANQRLA